MSEKKKKFKVPNTYTIVFFIILISALATWLVPGGQFKRETINVNGSDREIVVKDSFTYNDSNPQSWQVLSSVFDGFVDKADIIVFILLIGASFWVINTSRALDIGILKFLTTARKLERFRFIRFLKVQNILIVLIMLLFSTFGAVFGMSEETIAFVIIFVPLAIKMGYDSIVGVSMCFVGAALGFAGALLNPFTIGIAQGIAQIPLFSGIEYRFFMWVVINTFGITYILVYANRIYKNPKRSVVYENDEHWRKKAEKNEEINENKAGISTWVSFFVISLALIIFSYYYPYSSIEIGQSKFVFPAVPILSFIFILPALYLIRRKSIQLFILHILLFTILVLIIGVLGYGWYMKEIATLFFAMGLFSGIAMGYKSTVLVKHFLDGAKDIFSAAFIVALAGGIVIVLQDGGIIDTILYKISAVFQGGKYTSVSGMYIVQTAINMIMPSGSAKAALTMPLMAPFSDLIGISRQSAVIAFQLGDGITNMITPVSGVLLGVLSVAKIPYEKWVKWAWKFIVLLIILGFFLLIPTVMMNLNGF